MHKLTGRVLATVVALLMAMSLTPASALQAFAEEEPASQTSLEPGEQTALSQPEPELEGEIALTPNTPNTSGTSSSLTILSESFDVILEPLAHAVLTATQTDEVAPGTRVTVTLTTDNSDYRLKTGSFKLNGEAIPPTNDGKNTSGYVIQAAGYMQVNFGNRFVGQASYFCYIYSFVMPEHSVTVTAQTENFGDGVIFGVSYPEGNGLVYLPEFTGGGEYGQPIPSVANVAKFPKGFDFDFKAIPNEGYVAEPYAITGNGGYLSAAYSPQTGVYTITAPDRDFTLYPNFHEQATREQEPASYLIYTAEDLESFRDEVNAGNSFRDAVVRLGADIDLTGRDWQPIGLYRTSSILEADDGRFFEGVFDGDGYTVTIDQTGLFRIVSGAIIENVTIAGQMTEPGGALVNFAYNSIVRNCYNYADIAIAYVPIVDGGDSNILYSVSGLVCEILYRDSEYYPSYRPFTEAEIGIFDCINYGDVGYRRKATGDPVGKVAGVANIAQRIIRCGNEGNITGGNAESNWVYALGMSATTVECSYNTGDVLADALHAMAMGADQDIFNCYATGKITNLYTGMNNNGNLAVAFYSSYGEVSDCWATGVRSFPNYEKDTQWRHTEVALAPSVTNIAAESTKWNSEFNDDGTLLWQRNPVTYLITFKNGEETVYDIVVISDEGTLQTPQSDGSYKLQKGTFSYSGTINGVPVGGSFNVSNASKNIQISSTISFSVPPGAMVAVSRDGQIVEQAAANAYSLYNGTYGYAVSKEGYQSATGTLIASGVDRTVTVASLRPLFPALFEVPPGATLAVYLAGELLLPESAADGGVTYLLADGLAYTYTVGKEGYVGYSGGFVASVGMAPIGISLDAIDRQLSFEVTPAGATVVVSDGERTVTPVGENAYALSSAKTYRYAVSAPDYLSVEGQIDSATSNILSIALQRQTVDVAFMVDALDARVAVWQDGIAIAPKTPGGSVYSLNKGQEYRYSATAPHYHDGAEQSLTAVSNRSILIYLARKTVEFTVSTVPADAAVELHAVGDGEEPVGRGGAEGTAYLLDEGEYYSVSAAAPGYCSSLPEVFVAPDAAGAKSIALSPDPDGEAVASPLPGDRSVGQGGVYALPAGLTGRITIGTSAPVAFVGAAGVRYKDLSFAPLGVAGPLHITLQDVSIVQTGPDSTLDFAGCPGSTLTLKGVNVLDMDGYQGNAVPALVHVPEGSSLIIDGPGALYFYKQGGGAGIGGDSGEVNGPIAFAGAAVFGKGTHQGAVVGTGSGASGRAGDVIIDSGVLNLVANARGALIGGGAGGAGGTEGGDVFVSGGTVSLNVDYSGAAVGGGGYGGGNDSSGGNLYVSGGSVRTFIDANAVSPDGGETLWPGIEEPGVNDAAITAIKLNNVADAEPVHLLAFDTELYGVSPDADTGLYTVTAPGFSYSGGLHAYRYLNEDLGRDRQKGVRYTSDNWLPSADPHLYLYLAEAGQTLTVNGKDFAVAWDEDTGAFAVAPAGPGPGPGAPGSGDLDGDGEATLDEALLLVQIVNDDGLGALSAGQFAAMDINADGYLTMADVLLAVQLILRS